MPLLASNGVGSKMKISASPPWDFALENFGEDVVSCLPMYLLDLAMGDDCSTTLYVRGYALQR